MVKKISFVIIMLTVLWLIMPINIAHAESATIRVDPPTSKVELGETLRINVTVTEVTDLAVWEFQIHYNNTILNCTNVTEGPFLKQEGSTFFVKNITDNYNSTYGRVLAGCSLLGPVPGVNGSGTLATVTFQAKAVGETPLHLTGTTLKDSTPPPRHPIPHTTADGTVTVVRALMVKPTANPSSIYSGETSNIKVSVSSNGSAVSGATISLISDGGNFSGVTDYANGTYSVTFTAPKVTVITAFNITASATKAGYRSGQGQTTIIVQPSLVPKFPDYALYAAGGIIIVITIIIAYLAITRRWASKPPSKPATRVFLPISFFWRTLPMLGASLTQVMFHGSLVSALLKERERRFFKNLVLPAALHPEECSRRYFYL